MVALLMPFKSDNLQIDDASFVKYLEVGLKEIAAAEIYCRDATTHLASRSVVMQFLWAGGIKNVVVNG